MIATVLILLAIRIYCTSLAPLEQPDNSGLYLGAWYDRLHNDTPQRIIDRLNYKKFIFWQADINLTSIVQAEALDEFVRHVDDTKTNAFMYLTVYPIEGIDKVTDAALNDFANRIKVIVMKGRRVLIRYCSEMNGSWFIYGQTPTAFKAHWKKVITTVRRIAGADKIAFLWAPNSGNGYPFKGGLSSADQNSPSFDRTLDTNNDGVYDIKDDPYSPYYPGDDLVDWVGMSIYHYGPVYPYESNHIPPPNEFKSLLTGSGNISAFNFYEMFSGSGVGGIPKSTSSGGKPFFITETGACVHLAVLTRDRGWARPDNTGADFRANMKESWWTQFLSPAFLAEFPKIKGASFFEFVKYEENTWRDFTMLGQGTNESSIFGNDGGPLDTPTLLKFQDDMKGEMGKVVIWADDVKEDIADNLDIIKNEKQGELMFSKLLPIIEDNHDRKSDADCAACRVTGTVFGLGTTAYLVYTATKIKMTPYSRQSQGHRLLVLAMATGMASLGIYRGFVA